MSQDYGGTTRGVAPGTRLNGIYEIETLIATGGMGEVYKGRAIQTGDPVAIKMIRSDLAESDAAIALFRREASALHNLHHEAIVRYYVFSTEPVVGCTYLAMEFVDGQSLSDMLKRGPLSIEQVQSLQRRIATALEQAHEAGIVHRDISPDNIILPGGNVARAKVIDFGIARSAATGTVIGSGFAGKYNYVSPEQLGLFGGDVTGKSDIYSLGLVLAEALTGRAIDMGGSQVEVIEKRRKVPDLSAIDARMRPLLERMLQPKPEDRPGTMADVASWQIGQLQSGRAGKTAARRRPGLVPLLGAAAAVAVLAIGGGVYFWSQADGGRSGAQTAAAPPLLAPPPASPALSPPSLEPSSVAQQPPAPALTPAPSLAPPPAAQDQPGPATAAVMTPSDPQPANDSPLLVPAPSLTAPPPSLAPAPPLMGGAPPSVDGSATARVDTVARYVASYDGGDCFFVSPTSIGADTATIEAFGSAAAPAQRFDQAFQQAVGFEAQIALRQVTAAQCPLVTFLGRLGANRGDPPRMEIGSFSLKSGQSLTGMVDGFGNRNIEVLLVSDDGVAHSLTGFLKKTPDAATFTLRLEGSGGRGAKPQVVLALASSGPIAALAAGKPAPSARLFSAIMSEAQRTGQTIGVAAKFFTLE